MRMGRRSNRALIAPTWLMAGSLAAGSLLGCSQGEAGRALDDVAVEPQPSAPVAAQGAAPSPPQAYSVQRAPPAESVRPESAVPLNVLLITVDTLRADHLSCYGYSRPTSPCIDRLAAQGTLFERCIVQWPKTGPSMASMLSSTYGSTSGVMRETLKVKVPLHYELLPEIVQRSGWNTLGVVSNISLSEKFQYDQGFDRYFVHPGASSRGDAVTDRAIELLEKREPQKNFFLWAHYLDPHAPYIPPKRHIEPFLSDAKWQAGAAPPLRIDPRVADPGAPAPEMNDLGMVPAYAHFPARYPWVKEKDQLRNYVAAYDGDIRYVDEQIGKLLDWMNERQLLTNTVIAFTADHGEGLGGHDYYFEHGRFPYDDCAHVPLIVVHPDWQPRRVAAPVALMDLAPTLLDLLGLKNGWQFEGQSLRAWLAAGAPAEAAAPVFTESGYTKEYDVAVRRGKWKLIKIGSQKTAALLTGKKYELYDVEADPGETKNLVDEESEILEQLKEELDAFVDLAYAKTPPDPEGVELSAEEKAQMEALGYTGDG